MRVSETHLKKVDELVKELSTLEVEGRKRMMEESEKFNAEILGFYPEVEKAKILGDSTLIFEATSKLRSLYHKRQAIKDDFYRERERLVTAIENINLPYISGFSETILQEAKRIQGNREHHVIETKVDMNSEFQDKVYKISHNHTLILEAVNKLTEAHKKISEMRLSPLSDIKNLFDETIKNIPDDFPLIDVTTGKRGILQDFQSREEMVVFQTQQRFINLFQTPSFLPRRD